MKKIKKGEIIKVFGYCLGNGFDPLLAFYDRKHFEMIYRPSEDEEREGRKEQKIQIKKYLSEIDKQVNGYGFKLNDHERQRIIEDINKPDIVIKKNKLKSLINKILRWAE